jgi:hypothetical protein
MGIRNPGIFLTLDPGWKIFGSGITSRIRNTDFCDIFNNFYLLNRTGIGTSQKEISRSRKNFIKSRDFPKYEFDFNTSGYGSDFRVTFLVHRSKMFTFIVEVSISLQVSLSL